MYMGAFLYINRTHMYMGAFLCINRAHMYMGAFLCIYHFCSVSVSEESVFSSRVVDREFDLWSGKTKDYKIWYLLLLALSMQH
jgi:hypothetical protein